MPIDEVLPDAPSVAWYVGGTGSGKTQLALFHAEILKRRTGWPIVVLDSTSAEQFRSGWNRARSLRELVRQAWVKRVDAVWTPEDADEANAAARAVRMGRCCVFVVDEAAFWLSSQRGRGGELLRLLRGHRHAMAAVLLTTQHLSGDVPQEALTTARRLYAFRRNSPASIERLERWYGIERSDLDSLAEYQALAFAL